MNTSSRYQEQVQVIPIKDIHILNPRGRDRNQHRGIIESIKTTGLRRPVTVSEHFGRDGKRQYVLVCGQGRIEALTSLGHSHIPAIVVEADKEDCLVMSLIENIARRSISPIDIMREVGRLRERGHNDGEIAELIGTSASWVNMVGSLLEKGEERLLVGVQTGVISLAMAVDIAKATTPEIQRILTEAYENGLRGKRMGRLRRLLEARTHRSPQLRGGYQPSSKEGRRKVSASELRRLLEKEAEKERLVAKKAEYVHERLTFCVTAMKELLALPEFCALIKSEGVNSMPKMLATRMGSKV